MYPYYKKPIDSRQRIVINIPYMSLRECLCVKMLAIISLHASRRRSSFATEKDDYRALDVTYNRKYCCVPPAFIVNQTQQ